VTSFADHLAVARDESLPLARRIEAAGEAWLHLGQALAYNLDNYNALDTAEGGILVTATRYDRIVDAVTKWAESGIGPGSDLRLGDREWLLALLSP